MTANFIKNKEVSFDLLTKLYFSIKRIRCVEEKIVEVYPENEIRCPTHLSIGQEAVPAAISACLNKNSKNLSSSNSKFTGQFMGALFVS